MHAGFKGESNKMELLSILTQKLFRSYRKYYPDCPFRIRIRNTLCTCKSSAYRQVQAGVPNVDRRFVVKNCRTNTELLEYTLPYFVNILGEKLGQL